LGLFFDHLYNAFQLFVQLVCHFLFELFLATPSGNDVVPHFLLAGAQVTYVAVYFIKLVDIQF
jgi:hypothetical protein